MLTELLNIGCVSVCASARARVRAVQFQFNVLRTKPFLIIFFIFTFERPYKPLRPTPRLPPSPLPLPLAFNVCPIDTLSHSAHLQKIEFQTFTGSALYPTAFSLKYEFVDTDLGGDKWPGQKGDEPVPSLCSRLFRKKRGNFQSPRNVFLHGRGGAKNLTCLYRFEAEAGERVCITLSFYAMLNTQRQLPQTAPSPHRRDENTISICGNSVREKEKKNKKYFPTKLNSNENILFQCCRRAI